MYTKVKGEPELTERMTRAAEFRFHSQDPDLLFESVAPEMSSEVNPRSHARCFVENGTLILRVEAMDTAALRASLNMWLRLVNVANEMREIAEKGA